MSQQFGQQQRGVQLFTPYGQRITVGPEGLAAIRREAVQRGVAIIDELRERWQEIENGDDSQQQVDPQLLQHMQRLIGQLPKTLQTLFAATPRDLYWQGDQAFGPGAVPVGVYQGS